MNILFRLFESRDAKRARLATELQALKDRVTKTQTSAAARYTSDAYADTWVKIGQIEKQLKKLGPAKPKPSSKSPAPTQA